MFPLIFVTVKQMASFIVAHSCYVHAGFLPPLIGPKLSLLLAVSITFHELTLQEKIPIYDFYHTILHKTDNAELHKPIVSLFYELVAT
jgi:hypothetical protein